MHKSKLLALLLAVVMVASMIVVPVYATGDPITYGLRANNNKTTVAPNEEFVVTVSIDTNPGFTTTGVDIYYDKDLTVTAIDKELIKNSDLGYANPTFSKTLEAYPQTVVLASADAINATGDVVALTFVAAEEGIYEIYLDSGDNRQTDNELNDLETVMPEKLTINVVEEEAAAAVCPLHSDEAWTEIAAGTWTGGALEDGHYKLIGNQTVTTELIVAGNVCIDLNGNSITADVSEANHRNFNVSGTGTLLITDSGENGTISGGKLAEEEGEKKLVADYDEDSSKWGGNIYVGEGGKLYIYGGTITGGVAARGGNVYVNKGNLYMHDGTVTEGNAFRGGNLHTRGTAHIYGGVISKGHAKHSGNNVFVVSAQGDGNQNNATLYIYGGNISGGKTEDGRGSVYNQYSRVYIYGGEISSLECLKGSNTTRSDAFIYGGTFTGNLAKGETRATITIYNGVFESADVSAYLADCACVDDGNVWHYAENCTCAYTAALDQYDEYIDQQEGKHTSHKVGTDGNFTYPCSVCNAEATVDTTNLITCAACGKDRDTIWTAWDGAQTNGHFYVLSDLALSGTVTVNDGETLCLDLNGQTVTSADSKRMFSVAAGGTLNLMDSSEKETGILQGKRNAYSGAVINSKGTFNLYSGTIQGGHSRSANNMNGGNVVISDGTFNMTGGTIKNGKVESTNAERYASGGNIYITGSGTEAYISGGTIEGGVCVSDYSQRGGNISVAEGAQVTISGTAKISGGQATLGENIYARGADDKITSVTIGSSVTIGAGKNEDAADIYLGNEYANVTTYNDLAALLGGCEAYNTTKDAEEATCYVAYATLADALGAAIEGDTVNLTADIITDAGEITLDGFTLNLNGHLLTATSVDATINGGHVVDNADVKGKVDGDVYTRHDNEMLHVVAGGDSYFEEVKIGNKPDRDVKFQVGNTVAKYTVYVDMEKDKTMIDEALVEKTVQLSVDVTWTVGETSTTRNFVLNNDALIAAYAQYFNSKMLMVTISNIPEDVTALSCTFNIKKPLADDTVE